MIVFEASRLYNLLLLNSKFDVKNSSSSRTTSSVSPQLSELPWSNIDLEADRNGKAIMIGETKMKIKMLFTFINYCDINKIYVGQGSGGVVFHGRFFPGNLRFSGMGIEVAIKMITKTQAYALMFHGQNTQVNPTLDPLDKTFEYLLAEANVLAKAGTLTNHVRNMKS